MKIGIIIQILFFGLFIVTIIVFHKRLVKNGSKNYHVVPWKKHVFAMYATGFLIFVRSIFRFAEFVDSTGPLTEYEWVSYVFDAVLIWAAAIIMNVIHPSDIKKWTERPAGYQMT